jgi:hypothetical protein
MDQYTSIASIIAFVVVAIIIWLIGPRPPEATVGSEDVRATPPTAYLPIVTADTKSARRPKPAVPYQPMSLRGPLSWSTSEKPLKPRCCCSTTGSAIRR